MNNLPVNNAANANRNRSGWALACTSFEEGMKIATFLANTKLIPTSYQGKPEDIFVAACLGHGLGLDPLQSLTSIAVVNGIPTLYGDALKAICMRHGTIKEEWIVPEGTSPYWRVTVKRPGHEDVIQTFGFDDAIAAGLVSYNPQTNSFGLGARKSDAWVKNPKRMCQMRARNFACRDAFPDILKGINAEGSGYAEELAEEYNQASEVQQIEQQKPTEAELMEQMSNVTDVSETIEVNV